MSTTTQGTWMAASPSDVRSPCPVLNALANHGYIARSGRDITAQDFVSAMENVLHLKPDLTDLLAYTVMQVHSKTAPDTTHEANIPSADDDSSTKRPDGTFLHGLFHKFEEKPSSLGVRDSHQTNNESTPVINLNQLDLHGAIEHDVSLTRLDFAQGDNHSLQPSLLASLVSCSTDGEFLTLSDMATYRKLRYEMQKRDNKELKFGLKEGLLAYGEVALIATVFGNASEGYRVPVKVIEMLFGEEKLPEEAGWTKRLWPVLALEANAVAGTVKALTLT